MSLYPSLLCYLIINIVVVFGVIANVVVVVITGVVGVSYCYRLRSNSDLESNEFRFDMLSLSSPVLVVFLIVIG